MNAEREYAFVTKMAQKLFAHDEQTVLLLLRDAGAIAEGDSNLTIRAVARYIYSFSADAHCYSCGQALPTLSQMSATRRALNKLGILQPAKRNSRTP